MKHVSGNLQILFRLGMFLIIPAVLSCTVKSQVDDISEAEVSFVEPSTNSFTNNTSYSFKVQLNSTNKDITVDKAVTEIYEGPNCDPSSLMATNSMTATGSVASSVTNYTLQDGKTYSARVIVTNNDKSFRSKCSASVGVDTQTPNPVSVSYPTGNGFVSTKELLASWSTTTDNGISGLSDVPYRLRLFGAAACAGTPLQTVNSAVEQYKFKKLTQGVTYSVQISSVDKAGNESVLACSPYTEVDTSIPGFRLNDSTSIDAYSRVTSPSVSIDNDGAAAYWCFTSNSSFLPSAYTDPCPGGTGALSGWYTSRPSTLPIGSGDGLKSFNLWIFRGDGSLISHNQSSAAVTLDQTPPGNFTVAGIGGLTDTVFDIYLTSAGQPEVRWNASTDAVDYTVDIRTMANALVCSMSGVTGTDLVFSGCPALTNTATYKVRITSFDIARNYTLAPDFTFTVDRDPPGAFSITGITGGADVTSDHFFGAGNPTVNYGTASGSSHYKVQIKDTSGGGICTLGAKADQSGVFNYATEAGMNCIGLIHGGAYKAYVSAFDDGENETQASNNGYSFQVDSVVPSLTLDTVPATPTSNTFANFVFSYSDALSGILSVRCQLDGAAYAACTSPKNLTGLAEGVHTLNIKATDMAGNTNVQTKTWQVDLTNPVLTIDTQPAAFTPSASISISFHATDAAGIAGYTCKIDTGAVNPCTSPLTFTATETSHTVIIRATDNTGFYDEKTVSFTVDVTNPSLTLTSVPTNPSHNQSTASFWFNVSDTNLLSTQCQLDGAAYASCSSPTGFSGLASGSHTVNIKATDKAGNSTTQTTTWIIYNYIWITSGFSGCTATQPSWSTGAFGACDAAQPAWQYSNWGACSATCGGGTQSRSPSCPVVGGNQYRSVSCPTNTGTETRTVQCQRNDSTIVADTFCLAAKPSNSQSCSRNDCAGASPAGSQTCSRGGTTDCNTAQATSQSCNPQACCNGQSVGGYCWYVGNPSDNCDTACAAHGGYNNATTTYAGNAGGQANCSAILVGFGITPATTVASCGIKLGCYTQTNASAVCYDATSSAAMSGRQRVCACNQ